MSQEVNVRSALIIRIVDPTTNLVILNYAGQPQSFSDNLSSSKGPVPGAIKVTPQGVDVDFSQLVKPGYVRFMNNDPINIVHYGIHLADINRFAPFGEILPAQSYVLRLSRHLQSEWYLTGTGSFSVPNKLRFITDIAAGLGVTVNVLVEAFEH